MPSADRLIEIYTEASAQPAGAARDRVIAESCGGDLDLRKKVFSLLRSHESAGDFLKESLFSATVIATEKPGDAIGRYKLLELLGEGGCGVVYVAEQTEPVRRRVALKVIKLGMDTKQVIARFEAERQALAMMDSPNIAKVLDAGSTDAGRPYFVMELVRGLRITKFSDENQLSVNERLGLFIDVCYAIQHAHQKGIIHRDIKPSNILVTLHDGLPVPKVIDFGIAKATAGRLTEGTVYTQFLHFVGTPAYMSPEQVEMSGLDIDTRSDIYSLGVLLYELLTGQTPFDGQTLIASGIDAMRKTICEQEPIRPTTRVSSRNRSLTLNPHPPSKLSTDLDWIVLKCLEKDRKRRYDTANGLAADLKRHLSNEPVLARPQSALYKLGKTFRRNRVAFTAATAVAIALVIGTTVSAWQAHKARYNLYVANINLAGKAWGENNIDQLRQALGQTRTFPHRGFEWYYWQRQAHLNLITLRGHLKPIWSVSFSRDAQRILTGSEDHTARVWDAATGRELFKLIGHTNRVSSAAFSPDDKFVITGSDDRTARVWNLSTQSEITKVIHGDSVTGVAFSPDGQRIATSSADKTAKVWEASTGLQLLSFTNHTGKLLAIAFSPKGERIVTGGEDLTARVWDSTIGKEILTIPGHTRAVGAVAFSPDGLRVLTGSYDQIARLWDASNGTNQLRLFTRGPISGLDFSPNGQRIVTGSWDSTATVWNAASGEQLLTIRADAKAVMDVAFSPDEEDETIVTSGGGAVAQVWDASGARESLLLDGGISPATMPTNDAYLTVAISPDDEKILTAGGDYDEVGFSFSSGEKQAQLWDSATGKKLFTLAGHKSGILSAAFSSNYLWIVTGSGDQTARIWKAATGEQVRKLEGYSNLVSSVTFSPDSRRIFAGGADGTARMWDIASGRELLSWKAHLAHIRSVAFSPNGQWVATGSWDGSASIWNASTGQILRTNASPDLARIQSVIFSPDSKRLVAGGWPRVAIVWNVVTGREICKLVGHLAPVSSLAYSSDGARIVTGSWDRLAKLWDADTGRELLCFNGNGLHITSVAFSHDGRRIVTADRNRSARIWEAARPEQVAAWEAEEKSAAESEPRWREELGALLRPQPRR